MLTALTRQHAESNRIYVCAMVLTLALASGRAWGQSTGTTWYVPDDYGTIAAAIGDAEDGDEIVVRDGIYSGPDNTDLVLYAKVITVRSENGPEDCEIDCAGSNRAFYLQWGEGPDSVVDGFTIRNCAAEGILVKNTSHPTIRNCRMTENERGIYVYGQSNPVITDCRVTYNTGKGGIWLVDSDATISGCMIADNGSPSFPGAGIYIANGNPVITDSTITRNQTAPDRAGGGIQCQYSNPTIARCSITENVCGSDGGGLAIFYSAPLIKDCQIFGNTADGWGGGVYSVQDSFTTLMNCGIQGNAANYGGGVYKDDGAQLLIANSQITDNRARGGGGLDCGDDTTTIVNCTIAGNTAEVNESGGIFVAADSTVSIHNSILFNNSPEQIEDQGGSLEVTYSDVQGDWPGPHNIDLDPLFIDPDGPDDIAETWEDNDYHLGEGSPCIDAADNDAVPPDTADLDEDGDTTEPTPFDVDGQRRFADDPETEDTGNPGSQGPPVVDMGADEYSVTEDFDGDGVPDDEDNCPDHPNPDQEDCDDDGTGDVCAIAEGLSEDCNENAVPDGCDISEGTSEDSNGNGIPDECEDFRFAKLLASDGVGGERFGRTVAIDGDVAVVGAFFDNDNGTESGSAYVYRFTGGTWVEEQKLLPDDGGSGDRFGMSVDISGDVVIGGAFHDDDQANNAGAAYIFRFNGSVWEQEAKLTDTGGLEADEFGYAVAIEDNVAISTARYYDVGGDLSVGAAFVFRYDGADWQRERKLLAPVREDYMSFGSAVALSGETVVLGANGDDHDDDYQDAGSAYVFEYDGESWRYQAKLIASDRAEADRFGTAVDIDGDTIVVGAHLNDDNGGDCGSAYIYHYDGQEWVQQKVVAADNQGGDRFGSGVAVNGDTVIIGAQLDDDRGDESGSAYVYSYNGVLWEEEQKLLPDDLTAGDRFGTSAALFEGLALVGAQFDDELGERAGSAYVIELACADCNHNGICDEEDIAAGTSEDCQPDGVPDECQLDGNDCNTSGIPDECELTDNDCNTNSVPDECDIASGTSEDCQPDDVPDECQLADNDCNANAVPDECDISGETSEDCQVDEVPDECQLDGNDCNDNTVPDECDIAGETSEDCQPDDIPDECQLDGNDCNGNETPDDCESVEDCNDNGIQDFCDLAECDGSPWCSDCNGNETLDFCDINGGPSEDNDENGIPDECDGPDCLGDVNGDGLVDFADLLAILSAWGPCNVDELCVCLEDFDFDCMIGFPEILVVLGNWGPCDP